VRNVLSDPELNETDPLALGGYFPHGLVAKVLQRALDKTRRRKLKATFRMGGRG